MKSTMPHYVILFLRALCWLPNTRNIQHMCCHMEFWRGKKL